MKILKKHIIFMVSIILSFFVIGYFLFSQYQSKELPENSARLNDFANFLLPDDYSCNQNEVRKFILFINNMNTGLQAQQCLKANDLIIDCENILKNKNKKKKEKEKEKEKEECITKNNSLNKEEKDKFQTTTRIIGLEINEKDKQPSKPKSSYHYLTFNLHHDKGTDTLTDPNYSIWSIIFSHPLETINFRKNIEVGKKLEYDIRLPAKDAKNLTDCNKLKDCDKLENLPNMPKGTFTLHIFDWWALLAVAFIFYVWVSLIYCSCSTGLLRNAGNGDGKTPPFSLAKTQMAWWFAIIFSTLVFLWLVTGEMPMLSGQALSLLGISSATTIASMGISANKPTASGNNSGFLRDILSDEENGITIQRFQMLIMTLTLGIMFIFKVVTELTMPLLDPSMLALLGISAGTYVGLKIPVSQADPAKSTAAAQPPTNQIADAVAPTAGEDSKSKYTPTK